MPWVMTARTHTQPEGSLHTPAALHILKHLHVHEWMLMHVQDHHIGAATRSGG